MKAYDSLKAFLADDSFDIVLVATPNKWHKEMAVAALEAGKNVVCEKPMAITLAEADEMIAAAKRTGKLLTVHKNRRWDKDYQMILKTIESGKIGKVYCVESRVHGQNGKLIAWRDQKEIGGGVLLDWAPHMIDQILRLDGTKVRAVHAQMHQVISQEVEDYFKLLLRFESGLTAQIEVGTFCLAQGPRWCVHGRDGSILVEDFAGNGKVITDGGYMAKWENAINNSTTHGPTRTMAPRPPETLSVSELPNVDAYTDWTEFYRNFMAAIEGKEEQLVTLEAARRVMCVVEAARQSNESGMTQQVFF